MKKTHLIVAASIVLAFSLLGSLLFVWWKEQYPNYLHFQPTQFFMNDFYALQITSFVTDLWFTSYHMGTTTHSIAAYYRILTLEENFQDRWNLEAFDCNELMKENDTVTVVFSHSHLFTYVIEKRWIFYKNEPFFTCWINRTYLFDSENMNNQIIFDVKNKRMEYGIRWLVYETFVGAFGYRIDHANPDDVAIQTGDPTESQVNFYNAKDRDVRSHKKGEQEIIQFTVYANQHATLEEARRFLANE